MRFFLTGSLLLFLLGRPTAHAQEIRAFDDFKVVSQIFGGQTIKVIDNDIYSGDVTISILSFTNNTQMTYYPEVIGGNAIRIYGSMLSGKDTIVYSLCSVGQFPQCDTAKLHIDVSLSGLFLPIAAPDNYVISSLSRFNAFVMRNDLPGIGSSLNAIVTAPHHGTASIQGTRIIYNPHEPFEKDSLKYRICNILCSEAYVYFHYYPPNDPPGLMHITIGLDEDDEYLFQLTDFEARYNDPEDDELQHIRIESLPDHGELHLAGALVGSGYVISAENIGSLKYIPDPDYFGDDEFLWNATDGRVYAASPASCILKIASVNDPPVAQDDEVTFDEDRTTEINPLINDYDKDGSITRIILPEVIPHGTATIQNLKIIFQPELNYNGSFSFKYKIEDNQGLQDEATLFITINPVKDSIIVKDFQAVVDEDEVLTFKRSDFEANIDDPDELASKIILKSTPSHGNIYIDGIIATREAEIIIEDLHLLEYKPDPDYFGPDYFEWTAAGSSDIATPNAAVHLLINPVNDPPVAVEDTIYINEDQQARMEVIAEDDEDEDLDIAIKVSPENGTAVVDGRYIVFTPDEDYYGITGLEYEVADSEGLKDQARVIIVVNPVDDPPKVSGFNFETDEDAAAAIPLSDFFSHIKDPDNKVDLIRIKFPPRNGTLKINNKAVGEGQDFAVNRIQTIVYTPRADYFGDDKFQWTAGNSGYFAPPATTDITIRPVPDAPVAVNDTIYTEEDKTVVVYPLLNDRDADSDVLKVKIKEGPEMGTVEWGDDYIVYTPPKDYFGELAFEYFAEDPLGLQSAAQIVLFLEPTYDEPTLADFKKDMPEDHILTLTPETFRQQINDPDKNVDKILIHSLPSHGQLTIDDKPAASDLFIPLDQDVRVIYKPDTNYFGSDEIRWKAVSGEREHEAIARLTINIAPVNDPPVAVDDSGFVVNEEETIEIDVLQNDYDIENDPLYVTLIETPDAHLELTEDQRIRVTPVKDFFGELVFTYKLDDHMPGYNTATVRIEVINVNDPPEASDITVFVKEDHVLQFDEQLFLSGFYDADNDPLAGIEILSDPENGTLTAFDQPLESFYIPADSIRFLRYTPEKDYHGTDQFSWAARTGDGISSDAATVRIAIESIPDEVVVYKGFSPNGDGFNNQWVIDGIQDYPDNEVQVFNRSGLLIFQMKNYDNETRVWSGETNRLHLNAEKLAPDDTYFYVIHIGNGLEPLKGYVILRR